MGVNLGGEQEVMINVSLPDETRADSADGFDLDSLKTDANYQLRYILEIYRDGAEDGKKYRDVKYSDDTSVSFPVSLAPGRAYSIAVWADVVSQTNPGDLYYNTESLKNISINESYWTAMDEKRDAFYGKASLDTDDHVADMSTITLKRPFAKIRVISTDIDAVRNFDLDPTNVSVEYLSELYTSFDAVSGAAVGATTSNKVVTANYDTAKYADFNTNEATLFADYIFVPANGTIQFAMTVNAAAGVINTASFTTPIPVEVNKVTTIKGDVLTEGGNVSVKIENELGEKETINMVNTAESLQEIINNTQVGENANIALGGDIDLDDLLGAGILSTRAAEPTYGLHIPAGKELTLDLNGFTISHSKECKASYSMIQNNGNLTIIDSSEAKSGKISFKDTSAGDPTFGWGSYTISNYGGTLVVENGTIEHLGEQNKGNGEPNCHMVCAIWQYSGSTTINGGVISTPNYRSARLWGGDMTINGGEFEGQLWLQAVNNTSKLTINGGTFAPRGNDGSSVFVSTDKYTVNFAVTGGNFTTKIGMDKPFGCITGGKFTTAAKEGTAAALINDDYAWVEAEGLWTLERKPDVAKIDEVGYTSLAKAVAAVKDGETINLVANEVFTEKNYYDNGGWKDGLGYAGDKSFTIDLGGNTVSQNGALNDYLLWFKNVGSKANTITIKNGTLDAGTTAYCALCTANSHENELTINLEDITLTNKNSNGSTIKVRAGSTLNVNAGTKIIGQDSYLGIENWNATVNVYEGAEIYMNGTSSYNGCLIGVGGNGTINVYGGYGKGVSGGLIAMTSGGTINVSGGEWIANTDGTYANSNKSVLVAQSDKQYNAGAGNAVVNVTGGTFKGGYNCYGNAVGDAQINIKGGNFNADPANYVVAGYESVEKNGVYTVGKPEALAKFEAAIAKGGEVTLTNDITLLESVVIEGKEVVLDLNGKTVIAPLFSAFEVKTGAELTIKNGKVVAYESTVRAIGGKATIESGEYTSTGTAADSPATYRYSLDCREGGELIINGGTFKSNNGMINVGSTVTINGGKFENIVEKTMTRHFAYVSAPLTINDGEFYGKANSSAGGCFFCGAAAGGNIQVKGGKFTSLWTSGSVNRIFEVYFGGTINVTGGMFNTNGGIASFVTENTDEATKAAYPYVAK